MIESNTQKAIGIWWLMLCAAFSSPAFAERPWLVVTQTNKIKDLWQTKITVDGAYETFFTAGKDDAEFGGKLTHCGTIPPNELPTLRETIERYRRVHDGKIKPNYGLAKTSIQVVYYDGKKENTWLGERAQEVTTMVDDMTHADFDMALSFSVTEWIESAGEKWRINENGTFTRSVLTREVTTNGKESPVKETPTLLGPICRDELRISRKRLMAMGAELNRVTCPAKAGPSYVEFTLTNNGKTKTYVCNGLADRLPQAYGTALLFAKTIPVRKSGQIE